MSQTDTLPPGPELDALVAEAMGWTRTGHGIMPWAMPNGDLRQRPIPYSSSGNGMLAMREWLNGEPRGYVVTVMTNGFSGYAHIGGLGTVVEAQGKHGPHSLALALLAAEKAEKET